MHQVLLRALLVSLLVEENRISFSLLGKQSITVAGNQACDAEIQENSAPHSKISLSPSTEALSPGLMVSTKTLTKQHLSSSLSFPGLPLSLRHHAKRALLSFLMERHPSVSLFLSLCFFLSPSQQKSGGPDGWQPLHFSRNERCVI